MSLERDEVFAELGDTPSLGILGSTVSFENAADCVCKGLSEVAEKTGEALEIGAKLVREEAALASEAVREAFNRAKKSSKHNADLVEALADGSDFRIAFRKPGEKEWTRVRFGEEELLRQLALEEVFSRQEKVMESLSRCLGVKELEILV
jgi:hypothetical protein